MTLLTPIYYIMELLLKQPLAKLKKIVEGVQEPP